MKWSCQHPGKTGSLKLIRICNRDNLTCQLFFNQFDKKFKPNNEIDDSQSYLSSAVKSLSSKLGFKPKIQIGVAYILSGLEDENKKKLVLKLLDQVEHSDQKNEILAVICEIVIEDREIERILNSIF